MKLFQASLPAERHEAALLLDLDGLTLDTEEPQRPVYQRLLRQYCGVDTTHMDMAWALGKTAQETAAGIDERFGSSLLDPALVPEDMSFGAFVVQRLREERTRERAQHGVQVMPHVPELLSWADSISLPRGIATSREREVAHEMLEASQLLDRLHVLVGKGTEGVRELKPAPDIHQVTAKELRTRPERCWALEDSPPGVEGAYRAKTKIVYVPDARVAGVCPLSRRMATYTASSMEDAIRFLQREL